MVGVQSFGAMRRVLKEYWLRYRQINPSFYLFEMADRGDVCLEFCIPFYSHSDEGRAYKHLGLWVLSAAGLLGRGTSLYISSGAHRKPLGENEMGMNYIGKTWSTQFMFTSLLKTVYSKSPETQDRMIQLFAQDVVDLLYNGVTSTDGLKTIRMIHVGHKGDLPALSSYGPLWKELRSCAQSGSKPKGMWWHLFLVSCWCGGWWKAWYWCSFWGYELPSWVGRDPSFAWAMATVTRYFGGDCPLHQEIASVFSWVIHGTTSTWGFQKHFIASSWVTILESSLPCIPAGSVDAKFQYITSLYVAFFRRKGHTPYINEISRDTMGFPQGSANPIGRWSKGAASTEMMAFLDSFCQEQIVNKSNDPLLNAIVPQPKANLYWLFLFLMFVLYFNSSLCNMLVLCFCSLFAFHFVLLLLALLRLRGSTWWTRPCQPCTGQGTGFEVRKHIGWGNTSMVFWVSMHDALATLWMQERPGMQWHPNIICWHTMLTIWFTWVQEQHGSPNPLSRTNQVQEDFIGRPARISRRVSTRSLHSSLMLRSLIIYKDSIIASDLDDRGLDAYGDSFECQPLDKSISLSPPSASIQPILT